MDRRSFIASTGLLFAPSSRACSDGVWTRHRADRDYRAVAGRAEGEHPGNDLPLVRRIIAAYRKTFTIEHYGKGIWRDYFEKNHGALHRALIAADVDSVAGSLRDPAR